MTIKNSQRLIKLSVIVDNLQLFTRLNILPSLGFKFLGYPQIKVDLFTSKTNLQNVQILAKKGLSISNLSNLADDNINIEDSINNQNLTKISNSGKQNFTFSNGKSTIFTESLETLINKSKIIPIYVIISDLLLEDAGNQNNVLAVASVNFSKLVAAIDKCNDEKILKVENAKVYKYNYQNLDNPVSKESLGTINFSLKMLIYDEICSKILLDKLHQEQAKACIKNVHNANVQTSTSLNSIQTVAAKNFSCESNKSEQSSRLSNYETKVYKIPLEKETKEAKVKKNDKFIKVKSTIPKQTTKPKPVASGFKKFSDTRPIVKSKHQYPPKLNKSSKRPASAKTIPKRSKSPTKIKRASSARSSSRQDLEAYCSNCIRLMSKRDLKRDLDLEKFEILDDGTPPTLEYTHSIEGLNACGKCGNSPIKISKDYSSHIHASIQNENRVNKRIKMIPVKSKANFVSKMLQPAKSSSSARIRNDPDLNVAHIVDTRNLGFEPSRRKSFKNPDTGRLVIQMTKSSRMRVRTAKKNSMKNLSRLN